MPSRAEVLDQAQHIAQAIAASGQMPIAPYGPQVDLFDIVARHVATRVADALGRDDDGWPDVLRQGALSTAYSVRRAGRQRLRRLEGFGDWGSPKGYGTRLLAVPSEDHHLREMLPVAEEGRRTRRLDVRWLVVRADHAEQIRSRGFDVVLAGSIARTRPVALAKAVARLGQFALTAEPVAAVPAEQWQRVRRAAFAEAQAQLPGVFDLVDALVQSLPGRTDALLVGNPATSVGRTAVRVGQQHGCPSAAIQHGSVGPLYREWEQIGVDRICVWGPRVADQLEGFGVGRDRIVVTGAPWVDALRAQRAARDSASSSAPSAGDARQLPADAAGPLPEVAADASGRRPRVLVGLSGAGHSVAMPEHLSHVERLIETASRRGDLEWRFRLHRKDDPAIYERILEAYPDASIAVVPSSKAGPIHADLVGADVLVTVTSTTALDAMLCDVPVVTLGRPEGEYLPEFVTAGATHHAALGGDLSQILSAALERSKKIQVAARTYREQYYGVLDGGALARIVEALAVLPARASASPNR